MSQNQNIKPETAKCREWTDPFNSFNSWKGLMYREQYEGILKDRLLPPVEASIDPTYTCNVDCVWCNSRRILHSDLQHSCMSEEHLMNLINFLLSWGVKGFCFAGGGESTLHPSIWKAMLHISEHGCRNAVISNGIAIDTPFKQETAVRTCRWVGISLDAGDAERFAHIKKVAPSAFNKVVANIKAMAEIIRRENLACDLAVKYLIHPENADQISKACALARDLGVAHFHARPAASENIAGQVGSVLQFPMDIINEQLAECLEMQTENFEVFGVRHKFSQSFNLEHGFSRCLSSPLSIQCGADGKVYLCNDWRGSARHVICSHYPNPEAILDYWGSPKHLELIRSIKVEQCPRCTYGVYAKQIENACERDGMCVDFP